MAVTHIMRPKQLTDFEQVCPSHVFRAKIQYMLEKMFSNILKLNKH